MNMYNLSQLVKHATRITPRSKTLIDIILTTNANMCKNTCVVHKSFSDHSLVHTTITSKVEMNDGRKNDHVTKKFRSFKNFNVNDFANDLNNVNWSVNDTQAVNEVWDSFLKKFTKVCDNHAPIKTIRFKDNICPWLDGRDDIFNKMHDRDYHHEKAVNGNNDNEHWTMYKRLRNEVNMMLKEAKRAYFTDEINDSAGDNKKMWSTLKKLLPNKKGNKSCTLPSTSMGDLHLANEFNTHFVNIGSTKDQASSKMNNGNKCSTDAKFTFSEISVNEILDEINSISCQKASGLDNVSVKLLKYGKEAIAPILCKIFNMSLVQGYFPDDLKAARVTPIYKNGDKDNLCNYRPISILPVCSKILEKLVHKQLYDYVTCNNILYKGQSGFRKHHSTCSALHKTIDRWNTEIDNGNYVGALFIDLSKAFDMVNHQLLVQKLYSLGIQNNENCWFKSYLNKRTQCVSINNSISASQFISSGVPQGSILGPLLFLLFINDMPVDLKHSVVDMYADDTLIYVCDKDVNVIENRLNEDINILCKWLENNLMKANVNKTKFMLLGTPVKISHARKISISMNNNEIEHVTCFKYLGVQINANLKWNEQINSICRKVCKSIAVMRRIKPFVPRNSLITIYNTMFLSHIDYAITVWCNCGDTNLNRLQKLQNMAMRIILNAPFRTHINDMLQTLGFMNIRDRITYATGCMMYKVRNEMTPSYLSDNFKLVNEVHSVNTRGSVNGQYYISKCNTNYGQSTFYFKGSVLWNVLSKDIRQVNSLVQFKKNLKKDLKL